MSAILPLPTKEVDVDFLVFVERNATDLLQWDILTFFGRNPQFCGSTSQIAKKIKRSSQSVRPELGDLALVGILSKNRSENGNVLYRLTQNPQLRRMTIKLANTQLIGPNSR